MDMSISFIQALAIVVWNVNKGCNFEAVNINDAIKLNYKIAINISINVKPDIFNAIMYK